MFNSDLVPGINSTGMTYSSLFRYKNVEENQMQNSKRVFNPAELSVIITVTLILVATVITVLVCMPR